MPTLLSQLRSITSTESDDYFTEEYLLALLNRAKKHVIEVGARLERNRRVSLRFLDQLRITQDVTFDTFITYEDFYKTTASKPTNLNEWVSLDLKGLNLAELGSLFEVKHGNALPDCHEGYFLVYNNEFEFYLDDNTYTDFVLRYIKDSTEILATDETVDDLGDGAQRAILYHAATLMADTDTTIPAQLFKDEFNSYVRDLLDD